MDDLVKMIVLMSILPKLGGLFSGLGTSGPSAAVPGLGMPNIGGGGEVVAQTGGVGGAPSVEPVAYQSGNIPDVNSGDEATYNEAVKSQEPFVQVGGAAGLNPYASSGGDYGL